MNELPGREHLLQVVESISKGTTEDLAAWLKALSLDSGAEALGRLSNQAAVADAVVRLDQREAAWLAAKLLVRWQRIAPLQLQPAAAILCADEVWLARGTKQLEVSIATSELESEWEVAWSGVDSEQGKTATLRLEAPSGNAEVTRQCSARIRGKSRGKRCLVVASKMVWVRKPVAVLDPARQRLVLCDQTGRPAAHVRVLVDGKDFTTPENGRLNFGEPVANDATLEIDGQFVRVP